MAAGGIGLPVNVDKTEYMCFNQGGCISTLNGGSLKVEDKFTYLGSCVSSTKNNVNMRLAKAWTAIDRLSIIWKSDLSDKIKRNFCHAAVVSIGIHHMDADKTYREKARRELHKNATSYTEQILEATPHEKTAARPFTSHLKNHPN